MRGERRKAPSIWSKVGPGAKQAINKSWQFKVVNHLETAGANRSQVLENDFENKFEQSDQNCTVWLDEIGYPFGSRPWQELNFGRD